MCHFPKNHPEVLRIIDKAEAVGGVEELEKINAVLDWFATLQITQSFNQVTTFLPETFPMVMSRYSLN